MRIVFLGEDSFSKIVLASIVNAGYNVVLAASPYYNNSIHLKLMNYAVNKGIEYCRVKDVNGVDFCDKLRELSVDLIVTAHFEKLLKKDIIGIPRLGCINLHPSKLPLYRGMSPQHWPIINGDNKTGVTVHFIDEGVDTGDIICQKEVDIGEDMYVFDLQMEFRKIYRHIVVDAIRNIQNGGPFIKQPNGVCGSYYGRLKRRDTIISTDMRVVDAYRLVRGVSRPYMGAVFGNYIIWTARIAYDVEPKVEGIFDRGEKKYLGFNDGVMELINYEMNNN
jgi:methionyl-tRNA formyltransferase